MGGFRRPGRGGEGSTPWWLSGLSGGGAGGATPRLFLRGFWSVKSNQHCPGQPGYGRGVVGGGTHARARPRKSTIFALQDGKIPDLPSRGPALRGPRRRGGMGGQSSPTTPPLPGPSRPLTGGRRGSCGGGSDPRSGPRPGTPGRIPFHPREASLPPPLLAGFMRRGPGIRRNSVRAGPRSRPRKGLSMREGELSRKWGTCTPSSPSPTLGA
jgi:hypothetical protein